MHEIYYTDEQIKMFFLLVYAFLIGRYGEENVISAYVHMDETTPHMHFLFTPVVDDKKWNEKHPDKPPRKKVCAKQLMNKTELNMFHRVFQEYLDEHSEKDLYPVLNGTTIGGARTIAEMKAENALEETIMASAQANATKKLAEEEMEKIDAEVQKVQQGAQEYIETLHKREDAALNEVMNEFDEWAKGEEQKERANVREIKQSLEILGATPDTEQPLTELAKSLDKPLIGKDGKTYVAIPSPGKLIPLLKKVVSRILGAFGWSHSMQKKTMEHVEHARASLKAKLPQKKIEADQINEARWASEQEKCLARKLGKQEPII